jgi:hypothetical protein
MTKETDDRRQAATSGPSSSKAPLEGRTCFVATPIGPENSDVRKSADGLLREVIVPELEALGFAVAVPHELSTPGSITGQIVGHLIDASLVVANVSGLNPNVMYELAVRHATRKPVVILADESTKLPFDVSDQRTLFFENSMMGAFRLRPQFRAAAVAAIEQGDIEDNPIYRGRTVSIIKSEPGTPDATKYIIDRLESVERMIVDLARPTRSPRKRSGLAFRIKLSDPESLQSVAEKIVEGYPDARISVSHGPHDATISVEDVDERLMDFLREINADFQVLRTA